jgi:hypothetical protein
MQEHLSLILAHFAIYLGCHLKLQITTEAERLLLSNSASRLLIEAPLEIPPLELETPESLSTNEPIPPGVRDEPPGYLDPLWIQHQECNFRPYQNELFRIDPFCNWETTINIGESIVEFQYYSREPTSTAKTYSVSYPIHQTMAFIKENTKCPTYPGERLVSSPPKDRNLSNRILHRHRLSENTCEKCGLGLYGREMLRIHMRTHHGMD